MQPRPDFWWTLFLPLGEDFESVPCLAPQIVHVVLRIALVARENSRLIPEFRRWIVRFGLRLGPAARRIFTANKYRERECSRNGTTRHCPPFNHSFTATFLYGAS